MLSDGMILWGTMAANVLGSRLGRLLEWKVYETCSYESFVLTFAIKHFCELRAIYTVLHRSPRRARYLPSRSCLLSVSGFRT